MWDDRTKIQLMLTKRIDVAGVRTVGTVEWGRIMVIACRTGGNKTRYTVDETQRRIDEDHMLAENVPR